MEATMITVVAALGVRVPEGCTVLLSPGQAARRAGQVERIKGDCYRLIAAAQFKCGERLGVVDIDLLPKSAYAEVEGAAPAKSAPTPSKDRSRKGQGAGKGKGRKGKASAGLAEETAGDEAEADEAQADADGGDADTDGTAAD